MGQEKILGSYSIQIKNNKQTKKQKQMMHNPKALNTKGFHDVLAKLDFLTMFANKVSKLCWQITHLSQDVRAEIKAHVSFQASDLVFTHCQSAFKLLFLCLSAHTLYVINNTGYVSVNNLPFG